VAAAASPTAWHGVQTLPADAILGLVAAFKEDAAPVKVNVAQGAYRTDEGVPFVLTSIKEAERRVAADLQEGKIDKEYLPIEGDARFRALSARLALGENSPSIADGRVVTLQTISGTGAVNIAAASLKTIAGKADIWLSNPSWGNHAHIFKSLGFNVHQYTYLDQKTGTTLDFDGMVQDLSALPKGSTVLLHACAHNPTGIDPNHEQWETLANLFLERELVAFFDSAYQGYASGNLDADAASVRIFEKAGVFPIVCQSYAKSMGLYGERIGAVNFVCSSQEEAGALMSQVKQGVVRPIYSSPPLHGARLATHVLGDPVLFSKWCEELLIMSGRVQSMREQLAEELRRVGAPAPDGGNWSHITDQIGMFAFTGLSPSHVDELRTQFHIYMTRDGRMSMAGLKSSDIPYVAQKMKQILST